MCSSVFGAVFPKRFDSHPSNIFNREGAGGRGPILGAFIPRRPRAFEHLCTDRKNYFPDRAPIKPLSPSFELSFILKLVR